MILRRRVLPSCTFFISPVSGSAISALPHQTLCTRSGLRFYRKSANVVPLARAASTPERISRRMSSCIALATVNAAGTPAAIHLAPKYLPDTYGPRSTICLAQVVAELGKTYAVPPGVVAIIPIVPPGSIALHSSGGTLPISTKRARSPMEPDASMRATVFYKLRLRLPLTIGMRMRCDAIRGTLQYLSRQPTAFRAEKRCISACVSSQVVALFSSCRSCEKATALQVCGTFPPACMNHYGGKLVVIQAGAKQLLVFQDKTQRPDEMQPRARIRTQPNDVTVLGRISGWYRITSSISGQGVGRAFTNHRMAFLPPPIR